MNNQLNLCRTNNAVELPEELRHQPVNVVVETIKNVEGMIYLREEWDCFAEQYRNPLLSYNWFLSCFTTLCQTESINIFVLRSNGSLKAIAPLKFIHRLGISHLEIAGTSELMEPTFLLAEDSFSFEKMLKVLFELNEPFFLKRLSIKSDLKRVLYQIAKEKSFIVIEKSNSSQWIPIESSWDQFEKGMKSSQRSRIRRFRRRLEEKSKIKVEIYTEDSGNFRRALDEAFQIEASGWKTKNGTAVLVNKKLKEFFTAYLSNALKTGILRLFLLKADGKGIAMILGVEYSSKFWVLKVGYDEQWAHFAPGFIIHHESIRWAFEQRLKGYEFLGTSEPWIKTWTEHEHIYYTYWLFPKTLNGMMCLGIEGVSLLHKKISDFALRFTKKIKN